MQTDSVISCFFLSRKQVFQVLARVLSVLPDISPDQTSLKLNHSEVSIFLHISDSCEVHGHLSTLSRRHDTIVLHLNADFLTDG